MIITCLIIEDKPYAIDLLKDHISKIPFLQLIAATDNPLEGINIIRNTNVGLVFLDIQMPELNGVQVMEIVGNRCKFILTTAYSEYALKGYEHEVVDYLLKPISFERFVLAVNKAYKWFSPKSAFSSNYPNNTEEEYLFVKVNNRIVKVDLNNIRFIKSLENYIVIQTGKDKLISLQTLKMIEKNLPANKFVRVHRSYIISLRFINFVEGNKIIIESADIPIGAKYKDMLYTILNTR